MTRVAGNGEGSSRHSRAETRTLGQAMRGPSTTTPDVVVIESNYDKKKRKDIPNPQEDLWLSSADGSFSSPIIPLNVGQAPNAQVFYVHKAVLTRSEYFKKAFCGSFREAEALSMDLPEEDPAIFHFVVAFLYQGTFKPIKPAASVLVAESDNGKGRDVGAQDAHSDTDWSSSEESAGSETSIARSRRLNHRRARRHWERSQQKRPGAHRPGCRCPRCTISPSAAPCWNCGIAPLRPRPAQPPYWNYMPPPPFPQPPLPPGAPHERRSRRPRDRRRAGAANGTDPRDNGHQRRRSNAQQASANNEEEGPPAGRIQGEDMRAWLQTYALSLEVYICANKFLMDDFKTAIRGYCVDMLETAGSDAAIPEVLRLCGDLWTGVPESDELLKMVFARIGFLQPLLWQRAPSETSDFLVGNPEVAALILREAALRREEDLGGQSMLPSMESATTPGTRPSAHAGMHGPPPPLYNRPYGGPMMID